MKRIKNLAVISALLITITAVSCRHSSSDYGVGSSGELGGSNESDKPAEKMVLVEGATITGAQFLDSKRGVFIEGRTVTLSSFYISNFEVTQDEYKELMASNSDGITAEPSLCVANDTTYALADLGVQGKRPIDNVTWLEAIYFCNKKSIKEGLEPVYTITDLSCYQDHLTSGTVTYDFTKNGYRLPTEAEWEFAARGGNTSADDWNYWFSGATTATGTSKTSSTNAGLDKVGWYSFNNITGTTGEQTNNKAEGKGSHQVALKEPNKLGLYDMSGNVSKWCHDGYTTITTGTVTNPTYENEEGYHTIRGGDWNQSALKSYVTDRNSGKLLIALM